MLKLPIENSLFSVTCPHGKFELHELLLFQHYNQSCDTHICPWILLKGTGLARLSWLTGLSTKMSWLSLANLLCSTISMWLMLEFFKVGHVPEFYINSIQSTLNCMGVFKVLITLGNLGNSNHNHWKFCNSVNLW